MNRQILEVKVTESRDGVRLDAKYPTHILGVQASTVDEAWRDAGLGEYRPEDADCHSFSFLADRLEQNYTFALKPALPVYEFEVEVDSGRLTKVEPFGPCAIAAEALVGGLRIPSDAMLREWGDFSGVDFSACHELGKSVSATVALRNGGPLWVGAYPMPADDRDGISLQFVGPKGGPDNYWLVRIVRDGVEESGYSNDPGYALQMVGLGHLKMSSYGPFNLWPLDALTAEPSTAKPALPALNIEAGERYKGMGFCDAQ